MHFTFYFTAQDGALAENRFDLLVEKVQLFADAQMIHEHLALVGLGRSHELVDVECEFVEKRFECALITLCTIHLNFKCR